jgi:hypothetical protein
VEIVISNANITQIQADLLVMKHADGFYGADRQVASIIGFDGSVADGQARFLRGRGLAAPDVVFVGVGRLSGFRYQQIQEFGTRAVKLARPCPNPIRHLALTVHGPGYGLDPEQSFLSMVAGIVAEWKGNSGALEKVTIAEISEKRCELLRNLLDGASSGFGLKRVSAQSAATSVDSNSPVASNVVSFGARAEAKPRLFVAMPFANAFIDEFEIAFLEAAKASSFICERMDLESFAGDIVAEMKKRILGSHGVLALLNDLNPNVFLEVGFALAHNKPTILVAREGTQLPFDIRGHRCISYRSIVELRKALTSEIAALKDQGVLVPSPTSIAS